MSRFISEADIAEKKKKLKESLRIISLNTYFALFMFY